MYLENLTVPIETNSKKSMPRLPNGMSVPMRSGLVMRKQSQSGGNFTKGEDENVNKQIWLTYQNKSRWLTLSFDFGTASTNDMLCHPDDNPTIGLLLVKGKNKTVVEYSLTGYQNPTGVAEWKEQLTRELPENLQSSLPTIEEIEKELEE